jgi:predicted peptidase
MIARWAALLALVPLLSQDPTEATEAKVFRGSAGGALPYRLYRPKGHDSGAKFPLLLFLHGAGERGDDNAAQLKHGIRQFLAQQDKNPCFIVAPQCPKNVWWSALRRGEMPQLQEKPTEPMALTIELVDALRKELPLDETRLYVTGLSMGGYGTWDLLCRRPELFAAGVPVCGGGDPSKAALIAKVPQWIFHGDKDTAVPVDFSRAMAEALKKAGGEPKYTEYPGVGHNSWDKAYGDPELYAWLFAQKRK